MEDSIFAVALLPAAIALIMLSLGLELEPEDFRRVFRTPRGPAIGLANLLVLSPLLALAVAEAFGLAPALAVGLVLLGASPGGSMANMLTHLARGSTALSITMTAVSSVAAAVTVPLYLSLAIDHFDAPGLSDDIAMGGIVAKVFAITVVPLSIGMAVRRAAPAWVAVNGPRVKKAALGAFLLVVAGAVAAEWELVVDNLAEVALAAVALNVAAMACSFAIARAARLDNRSATAIAFELGLHNSTLAIAVGTSVATVLTIPAAVYSAFMFLTAGAFAWLMKGRNAAAEERERAAEPAPLAQGGLQSVLERS